MENADRHVKTYLQKEKIYSLIVLALGGFWLSFWSSTSYETENVSYSEY